MQLHGVVSYKEFYNKLLPNNFFDILKIHPTDAIMLILCRTNAMIFQNLENEIDIEIRILTEVFPLINKEKKDLLLRVYEKWNENKADQENIPIYFNEQSIVSLISIVLQNYKLPDENEIINESKLQNDVFDCILASNEIYYNQNVKDYDLFSLNHLWQLHLMQQFYLRDTSYLSVAPVKFLIFQKFVKERIDSGDVLISEFITSFRLKNLFDYASVLLNIIRSVFKNLKPGDPARWNISEDDHNLHILENFALRPKDFANGSGLGKIHEHLVPKPFYYVMNKFLAIIDFNFFPFLIDTALSFNFYTHTSLKKSNAFPDFKDFQSFLGKKFYEEYMAGQILNSIFGESHCRVYTEEEEPGFPDFIITKQERDIFPIEVKSNSVHFKTLEQLNVEKFKAYIDEHFAQSKEVSKKNKGVYQLVNFIRNLLIPDKFKSIKENRPSKRMVIYPIIIYTDKTMDIAGVNTYCDQKFSEAIVKYKSQFKWIYPLTLINIDFFILHYSDLRKDSSILPKMIKKYHKKNLQSQRTAQKNKNPYIFLEAHLSFSQYSRKHFNSIKSEVRITDIIDDLNLSI